MGVDLLIVAPGQMKVSGAIERAYDKGIPVIVFDRRTHSKIGRASCRERV